jgi:hypothetical protein
MSDDYVAARARQDHELFVERVKAAATPAVRELITTTYYRIWDECNPQTDDEQAEIEPATVWQLEGKLGELTPELVDYVIFDNEPVFYEPAPVHQQIGEAPEERAEWKKWVKSLAKDPEAVRFPDC